MHQKRSVNEQHKEKENIVYLVLMQTLTPISSLSSISQPGRICVRYTSYSARPFTVTISARINQLKLKIKSHLILPEQPPQQEFMSKKVKGFKNEREGWIQQRNRASLREGVRKNF